MAETSHPLATQSKAANAPSIGAQSLRRSTVSGSLHAFGQVLRVQIVGPPAVEDGASLSIRTYFAEPRRRRVWFLRPSGVTIEDARKLHLPHQNSVALIAERS